MQLKQKARNVERSVLMRKLIGQAAYVVAEEASDEGTCRGLP
ncbi:MAG: hypothetical protein QOJ40_941 [Verrucomicrobiota bacterium]